MPLGKPELDQILATLNGTLFQPTAMQGKGVGPQWSEMARPAGNARGTVVRAYHGTETGPGRGDTFRLPQHSSEKGVFFTPNPYVASQYGGAERRFDPNTGREFGWDSYPTKIREGSKVYPVKIDTSNSATIDMAKLPPEAKSRWDRESGLHGVAYSGKYVQAAIKAAEERGRDTLIIKNMHDLGGTPDQIVAIKPAGRVRSAITDEILFALTGAVPLVPNLVDEEEKKNGQR